MGVVPSAVFADVDGVSAVSDGDVEELSLRMIFRMVWILFLLLPVLWRIRRFLRVQGYQEAKAEAEVIAQERLEAEAAAEAARKAEEERKVAEEARWRSGRGLWILRCSLWGILMFMVVRV